MRPRLLALAALVTTLGGCCLDVVSGTAIESGTGEIGAGAASGGTVGGSGASSTGAAGTISGANSTTGGMSGVASAGTTGGTGTGPGGPTCVSSGRWIFVLDVRGTLARFDPTTLSFTDIGQPNCFGEIPFSMAVDGNAIAWAVYRGNLDRIDTSNASCETTSFVKDNPVTDNPPGVFGMSFMFDPHTGVDTLYVADSWLGTIAFPSLTLSWIAPLPVDQIQGDLAGTRDGELWELNSPESGWILSQIDPTTAAVISTNPLSIAAAQSTYAMKFWGDSFWIFINDTVFQVPRSTLVANEVLSNDGYEITGAGVADCASAQTP